MNAAPVLKIIAGALKKAKIDAVMIGNAAAALNGAPITTIDFDFFVKNTGKVKNKFKLLAVELDAILVPPATDLSRTYRIENDEAGIYLDFIDTPLGMASFESVRSRSEAIVFEDIDASILVASLEDIVKSKTALGRPKDMASLEILKMTLNEKKNHREP